MSPSRCERWYLSHRLASLEFIVAFERSPLPTTGRHSSYHADPVRNNPEPRGVVPPRAFRNVLLPAPLSGGIEKENEGGRSAVRGPVSFYFLSPPVGPRIAQPHTGNQNGYNCTHALAGPTSGR